MASVIGGLQNTRIKDRKFMLYNTEQEAVKIAMQCSKCPGSLMGKDAMNFIRGGSIWIKMLFAQESIIR